MVEVYPRCRSREVSEELLGLLVKGWSNVLDELQNLGVGQIKGIEALEVTCNSGAPANARKNEHIEKDRTTGLSGYGVKAINGKNVLSGPGLPAGDQPGVLMGGAKWPGRLMNKCGELVGDHGEDEIVAYFEKAKAKGTPSHEGLFIAMCESSCSNDQYESYLKSFAVTKRNDKEL